MTFLRTLFGDRRGAVAAYVAIMSFVLVGVGALAVDLGRLYTLETELQKVADARCIAAAAELDGEPDALVRATAAAQRLGSGTPGAIVENTQLFAAGGAEVDTVDVRFFCELPPDDLPLTEATMQAYDCPDPLSAVYDAVTVERKTLNNYLIRILGGPDTTSLNAVSVCGVEEVVCEVPGMMICNPAEPGAPNSDPTFFDQPGRLLVAKRKGGGSQFWKPGEFGLLDTPEGCTGTNCIREFLAQVQQERPVCFSARVNIRPGEAEAVRQGLNVRFGMYHGPMKNMSKYRGNANYRPSRNVVKGAKRKGSACDLEDDTTGTAMGLPRDVNVPKGSENRFGNGNWDFCGYWEVNHGPCAASPWGAGALPTRHQVYKWEIENAQIPDADDGLPTTEDTGKTDLVSPNQSCYRGPDLCMSPYEPGCAEPLLDRRELVLAVINCEAQGLNGNEDNVRVAEWYLMFLTEPIGGVSKGGDPQTSVVLETVGPFDDDRFLHREIIIYRGFLDVE